MRTISLLLSLLAVTSCANGYVSDPDTAVDVSSVALISCPTGDTLARGKLVAEWGCIWRDETHAYRCGGDDRVPIELHPVYDEDGQILAGNYEVENTRYNRVIATLDCTCSGSYPCTLLYQ